MCSDYERRLVQPVYENSPFGPRALSETHPLLQDCQVRHTNTVFYELTTSCVYSYEYVGQMNIQHFLVCLYILYKCTA